MSQIKNAQLRYRIIDRLLRNDHRPYPSKEDFRRNCEEALYGYSEGENICASTIEKDLFAMRMDHDAPIKFSKKYNGYYYTDENYSINSVPLTEDDLQAINFAVNTLSQFKDSNLFGQFSNAVEKISNHINLNVDSNAKHIQFETSNSARGNEYLPTLLDAIKLNKETSFDYASFVTGKSKTRKVQALFLKEFRNRWYLISYDFDKKDIVTYALERMKNLSVSEKILEEYKNFDPKVFFEFSAGITAGRTNPETIIFKANNVAAKYIESQPFHSSQKVIKKGKKKTTFELQLIIGEEFIRDLLSYGGELEVISPTTLKQEIVGRVVSLLNVYKS